MATKMVRVEAGTEDDWALIDILSPLERLAALRAAGLRKAKVLAIKEAPMRYTVGQAVEVLMDTADGQEFAAATITGRYNERQTPEHDSGWILKLDDTGETQEVSYDYDDFAMRPRQVESD